MQCFTSVIPKRGSFAVSIDWVHSCVWVASRLVLGQKLSQLLLLLSMTKQRIIFGKRLLAELVRLDSNLARQNSYLRFFLSNRYIYWFDLEEN